jgi:hypothetical protein
VFDATYFRTALQADVNASGREPIVDVHLLNGHAHRVRSVVDAKDNYVILETYQPRLDGTRGRQQWGADHTDGAEVMRAVVSYESVAEVVITPTRDADRPRIGFGG